MVDRLRQVSLRTVVLVEDAARAIGRARSNVYAWEEGRHGVDPVILRRLLEQYGVDEPSIRDLLDLRSRVEPAEVTRG